MSAPAPPRPARQLDEEPAAGLPGFLRGVPWIPALASGAAVLLVGAPVGAVVQGTAWWALAAVVVGVVVAAGLLLHRLAAPAVTLGQCAAVLAALTAMFTGGGVLGVLPGPAAFGEFGALLAEAGAQIDTGVAPVVAGPGILFLVTAAIGLVAVAVHLAAVGAGAPAAAGVPLLAVFAVPAALADDLLPGWAMAAAAAGFGLLLLATGTSALRRAGAGAALVAGAVLVALAIGAAAGFVGTAGRFAGATGGSGAGGAIGLSPFTALRGQLDRTDPTELFRVGGLPRPSHLRALTLSEYVPDTGWRATAPGPGTPLPGPIRPGPGTAGEVVEVRIDNIAFRDYWLPLYGAPLEVADLPESQWAFDARTGTGYTQRPRQEDGWRQRALLPAPSVADLRAAEGSTGVGPEYLSTAGVDPRVGELAADVVAGAGNAFDRALALQNHFTGPGSAFRYEQATAPGSGDDALVEFLTVGRVGYCEQFASAMAVMLRTVDIPARVAVGFTAGTAQEGTRSISTADAHAWVEAWFPRIGWTTFDPTPLTDGRAITPPYVLEALTGSAQGDPGAAQEQLGPEGQQPPPPTPAPGGSAPQPADPAAPAPDGGGGVVGALAVVVLLAAAALVPAGTRELRRRQRLAALAAGGPDAAAAGWAELLACSADRGVSGAPSDTVRGAARRLVREHHLDADAQQALRQVVAAVEASWYGADRGGAGTDLGGPVRAVAAGIADGAALSVRQWLLPRSVLHPPATGAPAVAPPERETAARRG